jgi:nicotinate-nucleotide pyrophosphorylase (carboxylating)
VTFSPSESDACARVVELAIAEDLDERGDITSNAIIPEALMGKAAFVGRTAGVLAGLPAVELVVKRVGPMLRLEALKQDGDRLAAGDRITILSGPMRAVLAAERTALNFLQRLSGIATQTRRYVDAIAGLPAKILDTRKTTPGWRLLEKYAVRMGGGTNHRVGLFDAILIKDNHLAALNVDCSAPSAIWDAVGSALRTSRSAFPGVAVEIEVDSFEQFEHALTCRPDIILLDNMPLALMRRCILHRNAVAPGIQLEASGGVNLNTVRSIAETGVDRISVGALTHSAPALDIALDFLA